MSTFVWLLGKCQINESDNIASMLDEHVKFELKESRTNPGSSTLQLRASPRVSLPETVDDLPLHPAMKSTDVKKKKMPCPFCYF